MKKSANLFLLAVMLLCSSLVNQQDYTNKDITGTWISIRGQSNGSMSGHLYTRLFFEPDSTAVFDNLIDTLYRYRFYIDKTALVLKDGNGEETRNNILKLDAENLVFETLANAREVRQYRREE